MSILQAKNICIIVQKVIHNITHFILFLNPCTFADDTLIALRDSISKRQLLSSKVNVKIKSDA